MKKNFFIFSIFYLISCQIDDEKWQYIEEKMGQAFNAENRGTMQSYDDLYVGNGAGEDWLDDNNPDFLLAGDSDCVVLYPSSQSKDNY